MRLIQAKRASGSLERFTGAALRVSAVRIRVRHYREAFFFAGRFVFVSLRKDRSTVSIARATTRGTSSTPFSHLATVFGWTPRVSASCAWVIPKLARRLFSSLPFMYFESYILENQKINTLSITHLLTVLYNKYRIRLPQSNTSNEQ